MYRYSLKYQQTEYYLNLVINYYFKNYSTGRKVIKDN